MADRENTDSTIPSLISSAWRTAPPVLRRFTYWVWSLGTVAVILAITADVQNRWGSLQFVTNILAELICGLFALPLALVIIARLAEYQVKELERVRLKARYGAALEQLTASVRTTSDYVQDLVQEVSASTNAFVEAARVVNGRLADPERALESAHLLQAHMDSQQWLFYERVVTPLRIDGNHLRALLSERVRNGEPTVESARFERIWNELESALRHQRQIMSTGHQELARGVPNANRATRLRNAAIVHLHSVDHLLQLCGELEAFATEARELLAGPESP
ncbi:hypothetical protein FB565_000498 [Actinoplanes lutulentus]|uniref:Uncharacterized protein n=1 Tax=Actinoplanes lutulentus TaxID=1287878 RepID=A0A327ZNZ7_9ACTN|nr:hypothetical protein [Actinoplanes lutulentus]MBB2940794.1 hypothetical protein [Actinoplanes lutulentus]RAK43104.1 hypothetical protein B0I29_101234 [Actinoplanes lutulentus]